MQRASWLRRVFTCIVWALCALCGFLLCEDEVEGRGGDVYSCAVWGVLEER